MSATAGGYGRGGEVEARGRACCISLFTVRFRFLGALVTMVSSNVAPPVCLLPLWYYSTSMYFLLSCSLTFVLAQKSAPLALGVSKFQVVFVYFKGSLQPINNLHITGSLFPQA